MKFGAEPVKGGRVWVSEEGACGEERRRKEGYAEEERRRNGVRMGNEGLL